MPVCANEDDSLDSVFEIQESIFSFPVYTPLTARCVKLECFLYSIGSLKHETGGLGKMKHRMVELASY